jgi:lipopolysaccharide/colanic/teichoic acid biosynthesis glycosyltransferase
MWKLNFLHNNRAKTYADNRPEDAILLKDPRTGLYREEYFNELLSLERKRCERSRGSILLMLADLTAFEDSADRREVAKLMCNALSSVTRETDVKGWYLNDSVAGIAFTDMAEKMKKPEDNREKIIHKCTGSLSTSLGLKMFSKITLSWQIFPEEFPVDGVADCDQKTHLNVRSGGRKQGFLLRAKRFIDVLGSLFAIIWFAPIFLSVPILIKISSKGPVLFKQERIGLAGARFMLLKFRSMHVDNDPTVHKDFVRNLILAGKSTSSDVNTKDNGTYKIKNDPRVTLVGRILRKTSLDEIPQFINVLKGDMSLVGPRPPLQYECEIYDVWHRRRVLDMKPGITGLWQVTGRSRTTFDDMVRMDIRYIRDWSLWLDMKIILRTPFAVLLGEGAL